MGVRENSGLLPHLTGNPRPREEMGISLRAQDQNQNEGHSLAPAAVSSIRVGTRSDLPPSCVFQCRELGNCTIC